MESRSECQAVLANATVSDSQAAVAIVLTGWAPQRVGNRLQSQYFNIFLGEYNGGALWTDSNAVEDLHNLMLAAGSNTWSTLGDNSLIGRSANFPFTDWNLVLGGSNDDAQWIILALWKVADYKASQSLSNTPFMNAASTIYNIVAGQWDATCGGGVWWSTKHTYKNSITNELFLLTSAEGYLRTKEQSYLDNANKAWAWLSQSGLRNSNGLWNDGLDFNTCQNNGETTWTYNQGVIASGLGALYAINGDSSLLDAAEVTLDATIAQLTENGILKESCDDTSTSTCDSDQKIFKGIWTKHVQYYLTYADDPARTAKYAAFLGAQAAAVQQNAETAQGDIGSVWYSSSQGGATLTPSASTGGLEALIAAAQVRVLTSNTASMVAM
ncbi:glycoside hydrolase family 76 protein [Artomyces pyxidatus]|uniref:Glycoside hydrolase family 76 protein n=1 Tax=Artomyces pyxidatus TaxID=48021 RepID=A0ACB8T9M9_9AGAM|nr:glycoside hydrolase family 76 protein [Artomyces pyxidatus]